MVEHRAADIGDETFAHPVNEVVTGKGGDAQYNEQAQQREQCLIERLGAGGRETLINDVL